MDDFLKDFGLLLEMQGKGCISPISMGLKKPFSRHALYYYAEYIVLYAVFVPHITEYIYQQHFAALKTLSLCMLTWEKETGEVDDTIIVFGDKLKKIIADVRKYKSENNLSMRTEMNELFIDIEPPMEEMFRKTIGDIKACCRAEKLYLNEEQFLLQATGAAC